MAKLGIIAQPAPITTGTTVKTLVQLVAPANQKVVIKEISISFNGVSNTATPILVELVRQTSAGTITNTTTLRLADADNQETIQSTCKDTATAEPTDSGAVLLQEYVHPQTGYLWMDDSGSRIVINGGGRLGLRVTAVASVSASVRLAAEE